MQRDNSLSKTENRRRALWQVPVLLILATIAGLGANALRTERLPLIADGSVDARLTTGSGQSLRISLENARQRFYAGTAVFVDARSPSQYAAGHIQGAVSLPWENVDTAFMAVADRLPTDGLIITYCDGETCRSSHDLAHFLLEMGYENVRVLVNGWSLWVQRGLPVS